MSDPILTISVVIPAYNAAEYIARTIESVLTQTHPADEIIVVDDGSSDNTADVVRSFGDKVIFLRQENAGASVARNTGIQAARYDRIAFLDADDEWVPKKLELQIEHLQSNPDLVWTMSNYFCCCCEQNHRQWVYDQGRSAALLAEREYYEDYFDSYKNGTCGYTGTMLINKTVLFEAGLFRPGQLRMNDEDMWFRIAYRYPKVGYLTEPLVVYHQGTPDSIVKKHNTPEIIIELLNRHIELASQQGRLDVFLTVARSITKMWIHWSWEDQRTFQIRLLLKELGYLLPIWYRVAVYLLTISPGLTLRCMPVLRKINKVLKIGL
ncbi:MAG: glycosyltransferase family 2 protein [Phycisphaerae bacterium]|nr:glycosyltransferase family 2 protein [Phycisphaerae bacterium]